MDKSTYPPLFSVSSMGDNLAVQVCYELDGVLKRGFGQNYKPKATESALSLTACIAHQKKRAFRPFQLLPVHKACVCPMPYDDICTEQLLLLRNGLDMCLRLTCYGVLENFDSSLLWSVRISV